MGVRMVSWDIIFVGCDFPDLSLACGPSEVERRAKTHAADELFTPFGLFRYSFRPEIEEWDLLAQVRLFFCELGESAVSHRIPLSSWRVAIILECMPVASLKISFSFF